MKKGTICNFLRLCSRYSTSKKYKAETIGDKFKMMKHTGGKFSKKW